MLTRKSSITPASPEACQLPKSSRSSTNLKPCPHVPGQRLTLAPTPTPSTPPPPPAHRPHPQHTAPTPSTPASSRSYPPTTSSSRPPCRHRRAARAQTPASLHSSRHEFQLVLTHKQAPCRAQRAAAGRRAGCTAQPRQRAPLGGIAVPPATGRTRRSPAFARIRSLVQPDEGARLSPGGGGCGGEGGRADLRPWRRAMARSTSQKPRPYSTPPMEHFLNSMRFWVRVPVLSEKM